MESTFEQDIAHLLRIARGASPSAICMIKSMEKEISTGALIAFNYSTITPEQRDLIDKLEATMK